MSTARRTLVRAAAVACAGAGVLALPAAALADGMPATAPRTLVKSLTLADGVSTARVYRLAEGAYQAEIKSGGVKVATLSSRDGVAGSGGTDALRISLQPDGRLSSWVPARDGSDGSDGSAERHSGGTALGRDGHKTAQRDGKPTGAPLRAAGPAEALRLDTLADEPGDGLLLIAAGGGMAAVGAAGLGFAMLRRGRTDS
ncbi:hypothetical protein DEJ50_10915 [Streptomyces venezuelae]|uniref:Uncharacterized protein n=1 Tax=Streptomyces venezuelae TaxID=54571 RepID=A0A5P2D550_STRVZ|nr:hypothetical protein [Streptomyces venezuelae]QES48249.1 hypothetical protein DEJ50_10915 [Streptomyces venezuelae]